MGVYLFAERHCVLAPGVIVGGTAGGNRPVRGAVIDIDVVIERAEVLHDVDFAASRPTDRIEVLAEHPECWPNALTERGFDAGDDHAILPTVIRGVCGCSRTAGLQSGRRVLPGAAAHRADDQIAVAILEDVLAGIGIGFSLTVAPSAVAEIVIPFGGIGWAAGRPVELVAPDELPTRGLRRDGGDQDNEKQTESSAHGLLPYSIIIGSTGVADGACPTYLKYTGKPLNLYRILGVLPLLLGIPANGSR